MVLIDKLLYFKFINNFYLKLLARHIYSDQFQQSNGVSSQEIIQNIQVITTEYAYDHYSLKYPYTPITINQTLIRSKKFEQRNKKRVMCPNCRKTFCDKGKFTYCCSSIV